MNVDAVLDIVEDEHRRREINMERDFRRSKLWLSIAGRIVSECADERRAAARIATNVLPVRRSGAFK
jgi:hypothetical protein